MGAYLRLWSACGVCLVMLGACARRNAAQSPAAISGEQELERGGTRRTYTIHVPSSYTGDEAIPLVLVFHGGGGTGEGVEAMTGFSALADREGFIVVYPDGVDKRWRSSAVADRIDDVQFVRDLVAHLARAYRIDTRRVYATGISNGAVFTNRLGCELSNEIAAIGTVAGTMDATVAQTCKPARPMPVIAFHGTDDPIVPYGGGTVRGLFTSAEVLSAEQTFELWSALNGCPTALDTVQEPSTASSETTVQLRKHATCRGGSEVERYVVDGGGHTWPGGGQYLPAAVIGETDRNVSATERIWEFFQRHPMP